MFVRARGDLEGNSVVSMKKNACEVRIPGRGRFPFIFDGCFGCNGLCGDQDNVYQIVGKPVLEHAFAGFNSCILSYGATGSGKTFSMFGPPGSLHSPSMGIVPRLCNELFDRSSKLQLVDVRMSMVEVYMEDVFDLLNDRRELKVKWVEGNSSFEVAEAHRPNVISYHDVVNLLAVSERNKTVAATSIHERSSRAHTLCELTISLKCNGSVQSSRIALADLAGSERVKAAGTDAGVALNEACNINLSLLTLGRCIESVVCRKPNVGEFRSSTLTKILKDFIGGNSVTSMLVTVSPTMEEANNTIQTLRFADRARRIQTRAHENSWSKPSEEFVVKGELQGEYLRRQELVSLEAECERKLEAAQQRVLDCEGRYAELECGFDDLDQAMGHREKCEEELENVRRQAYPREYSLRNALDQCRQSLDAARDQHEMSEAMSMVHRSSLEEANQRNCELEDEVEHLRRRCSFFEDENRTLRGVMEAKVERLEGERSQLLLNYNLMSQNVQDLQSVRDTTSQAVGLCNSRMVEAEKLSLLSFSWGTLFRDYVTAVAQEFAHAATLALSATLADLSMHFESKRSELSAQFTKQLLDIREDCAVLHSTALRLNKKLIQPPCNSLSIRRDPNVSSTAPKDTILPPV